MRLTMENRPRNHLLRGLAVLVAGWIAYQSWQVHGQNLKAWVQQYIPQNVSVPWNTPPHIELSDDGLEARVLDRDGLMFRVGWDLYRESGSDWALVEGGKVDGSGIFDDPPKQEVRVPFGELEPGRYRLEVRYEDRNQIKESAQLSFELP